MNNSGGFHGIRLKCGESIDCPVKKLLAESASTLYQIHMLKNCLHCDGQREPSLEALN